MPIPFTQYLRPDGAKRDVSIERPPEIEALAQRFIASGGRFECEELRTGEASLTAVKYDRDVAIKVVPNGPAVLDAVDAVVRLSQDYLAPEDPQCSFSW
jgi:hypothetical protein